MVWDEEAKAAQEIAKTSGKAVDAVRSTGAAIYEVFGDALREYGGTLADNVRLYRYRNALRIADEVRVLHKQRGIDTPVTLPPSAVLPLLEGASLEADEGVARLWANLIANATDPGRAQRPAKVFIEILRGLEPLDAKLLSLLAEPHILERYPMGSESVLNLGELAARLLASEVEVKLSLQTLARYGCVLDNWQQTYDDLDHGQAGFRVNNPKSNFRLSDLGRQLVEATLA